MKGLKVSSCETRGGDRQIVYRPQWCEICTWLIKILGLSMFSSSFIPFSLSSLPHFHMEGILGDAEQILPDLLTSSYFTRSTPIDELFIGRTTSENVSHDNSAEKEGLLSLASSFPTTSPFNPLLNDNIHLSLICLLTINVDRYPKRILSEVWCCYIFQSCLCKYVRSRACCNYLGIP